MRIRRADLPEQNSQAVYQRMQTERQREAAEFRAQGSQKAQEIRSKADRDVTVLVAEATSKAEQIRGEGDAERNRIFADAFGRDPDFFAFYRSMQAYEAGMKHNDTRHGAQAGFRVLPLFRRPVGQAARAAIGRSTGSRRRPPRSSNRGAGLRRQGRLATMSDFLVAIGLVFAIEGLLFAAFPARTKRAMAHVLETPDGRCGVIGHRFGGRRACVWSGWCAG